MLPDKRNISLIVLAAGNSTRMGGGAKQLLDFGGESLLRRAASIAIEAEFERVVIVLGANAVKIKREIEDLSVGIVVNGDWGSGISSSIKAGISAFSNEQNVDAVVIMLCDQPFVTSKILRRLCKAFARTGKPVVACRYAGTIGVPALFARSVFADLMDLQADEGAKKIIKKYEAETAAVDAPEAAFDVDTVRDYEKLKILSTRKVL